MTFHVKYKMFDGTVGSVDVSARSREEAEDKAIYDIVLSKEGKMPYDAWATSVTYQNGNYKQFIKEQ